MTAIMSKSRFPTGVSEPQAFFYRFTAESSPRPVAGVTVQGIVSKATGLVSGYVSNPDRVRISLIVNGQGGDLGIPILPNERLEQVGDTSKWLDMASTHKKSSSITSISGQAEVAI